MGVDIFRALKHRNFRLHFTGQAVSLMGTWMQRVAVSWLVYRLTESALMLGLVSFLALIPSLILSPFIGSFVDRHQKYRIVVITQFGLMLQAGALALLVFSGYYSVWWIAALSFIQGVINTFDVTARQSLMVELVDDKADLPNAIALNSSAFNAARMLGPAIGGILLSMYGEAVCFAVNFISFIAVIGSLLCMRLVPKPIAAKQESTWRGFKEGFSYLRHSPHLLSLILLLTASSLCIIPYTTLLPVIAREMFHGDAATFSLFESSAGLGAMIGAIYMARTRIGINLRFRVMKASALFASGILVLSFASWLPLALLSTLLAAMGMMVQNSSINTYIQTHAMPAYRARAISYYIMAFQGIFPLGSLLVGALANAWGIHYTLLFQGIAGATITLSFILYIYLHINRKYVPV
ncbi:Transmembrane secretion effector [Parapedobacter composti]|uniref:Transmembrane secretion effector n=1 Tax=Parapedobacter composti TaxID=623281 RepID=A0A1I1HGM1_9SPHI|nr:MFS transporter [Parapedobacter composti]SFC23167.1 Transmembrane secretion effector [Parapedobacter composti]